MTNQVTLILKKYDLYTLLFPVLGSKTWMAFQTLQLVGLGRRLQQAEAIAPDVDPKALRGVAQDPSQGLRWNAAQKFCKKMDNFWRKDEKW